MHGGFYFRVLFVKPPNHNNKMKNITYLLTLIISALLLNACSDVVEIDVEKPTIDLSIEGAFPTNCDTLYFDEPFTVKAMLKDNMALGSYNIDIHNNFDQHNHSTEIETCNLDEKKKAVNPYVFIADYSIEDASEEHLVELEMTIPSSDDGAMYDEGDYHFKINVVDQEGWSTLKGLNIKILKR